MEKKYFFLRSHSPRPTFQMDMTPEERAIMMEHIAHWKAITEKGFCIVYGPVMEPPDAWGLAIVEVEDEEQVKRFIESDPAFIGKIMTYGILPDAGRDGERMTSC